MRLPAQMQFLVHPRPLAAALLLALTSACINTTPAGAVISTFPPGARLVLNGHDSGYVTPCVIGLDTGETYKVRIELDGYQTFAFRMARERRTTMIYWSESETWPGGAFHFPLFLPMADMLAPIRVDRSHSPARVHVRLDPMAG